MAQSDLSKEHDARQLVEHERDDLQALLAKLRAQIKSLVSSENPVNCSEEFWG